jgi:hypothetical protein
MFSLAFAFPALISFPYGRTLPVLPGLILALAFIFTLVPPYCHVASTIAIILGAASLVLVLLPACVRFRSTGQIKTIFYVAAVFCVVNLIMEAICHVGIHSDILVASLRMSIILDSSELIFL